jgi:hypothetical protein
VPSFRVSGYAAPCRFPFSLLPIYPEITVFLITETRNLRKSLKGFFSILRKTFRAFSKFRISVIEAPETADTNH